MYNYQTTPKDYQKGPIEECGEEVVEIPENEFPRVKPHPYKSHGAPYGGVSPWMVRLSLLLALREAQKDLTRHRSGWRICIFDGLRPIEVQAFEVEKEFQKLSGKPFKSLTDAEMAKWAPKVFTLWGIPSNDPRMPPPHSTGGALDVLLVNRWGWRVWMGSKIDENSDRSKPDYFAKAKWWDILGRVAHRNRKLLNTVMVNAGFTGHRVEWWHFSMGDQYAEWRRSQDTGAPVRPARYGRADLIEKRAA